MTFSFLFKKQTLGPQCIYCQVSIVSSKIYNPIKSLVSCFSLCFFITLTLLKSTDHLFCRVPSIWFPWCFLMIWWGDTFEQEYHLSDRPFLQGYIMSLFLIIGTLILITWLRRYLSGFFILVIMSLRLIIVFDIMQILLFWYYFCSIYFHPLILVFTDGSCLQQLLLWCLPNSSFPFS